MQVLFKVTIFVFLVSPWIYADHVNNEAPHVVLTEEELLLEKAVQRVADWVKEDVHITSRAMDTYHYVESREVGPEDSSQLDFESDKVKNHHQLWGDYYWNLSQPHTGHVRALYLASDPIASRSFGGKDDNWVLYRVTTPSGTTLLDVKPKQSKPFPTDLQDILVAAGCTEKSLRYVFLVNRSSPCRKVGVGVLKKLGIEAISYGWISRRFESMPKREGSALIVVRPSVIPPSNIAIFTKYKSVGERPEEKGVFQELRNTSIDEEPTLDPNGKVTFEKPPVFWPTPVEKPTFDLKNWMNQHWMDVENPIW